MDRPDAGDPESRSEEPRPDWWRRNAEEFREHGLPDYRPPRFEDDELVPPVVEDLEAELGVSIRLRVVDPQEGNRWEVLVDGEPAGRFDRERHVDGYSLFHATARAFESMVREAADG